MHHYGIHCIAKDASDASKYRDITNVCVTMFFTAVLPSANIKRSVPYNMAEAAGTITPSPANQLKKIFVGNISVTVSSTNTLLTLL